MWYILNTNHVVQSILDDVGRMTIEHHYREADNLYFEVPYSQDLKDLLQVGNILSRAGENKGYRLHTVEIDIENKTLIGSAYGLEGITAQRVIERQVDSTGTASAVAYNLVNANVCNPPDAARKVPMTITNQVTGTVETIDANYHHTNLYEAVKDLAQTGDFGITVHYEKKATPQFRLYRGKDRTQNQTVNTQVIWRSDVEDTLNEKVFQSDKEYKSVVYVTSGDEKPIRTTVNRSTVVSTSWERYETAESASDIRKDMFSTETTPSTLTNAQILSFLTSRGRKVLSSHQKINEYQFELAPDIPEKFGTDYDTGDLITIKNDEFGIQRSVRIITVIEEIEQTHSTYTIHIE